MGKRGSPVPDDLTDEQKWGLVKWINEQADKDSRFGRFLDPDKLRIEVGRCLDHHGSKGNPKGIVDWVRAVRNWLRINVDRGWDLPDEHERAAQQRRGGSMAFERAFGVIHGGRK